MAKRPNINVTVLNPPAIYPSVKTIRVASTDTTRFDAFGLPKGAIVLGASVTGTANSGAATSAVVSVGTGGSGTELINAYNVKTGGVGFNMVGAAGGTHMGTQLMADTLYTASYTGVGGGDSGSWLVAVYYYIPQQGMDH